VAGRQGRKEGGRAKFQDLCGQQNNSCSRRDDEMLSLPAC